MNYANLYFEFGAAPTLLVLAFFTGRYLERRHFQSLDAREAEYADIITTNLKSLALTQNATLSGFVHGEVVVGSDYFKTTFAYIKSLFGGNLRTVESLMVRARREALLRLLEEARALGATHVINIRYEATNIGGEKTIASEIHAYGTAVRVEN